MAKEPTLTFRLSRPSQFQCSLCPEIGDQGAFTLTTTVRELVEAFEEHVKEHHPKHEDVNQAAARIVREGY